MPAIIQALMASGINMNNFMKFNTVSRDSTEEGKWWHGQGFFNVNFLYLNDA